MKFLSGLSRGAVVVTVTTVLGSSFAVTGAVLSAPARAAAVIDTSSQSAFIRSIAPLAQEGQRAYEVPASVAMAQAILESGWGKSSLTTRGNAFFGIKCSKTMGPYATGCLNMRTREVFNGTPTYIVDGFRTYDDPVESLKDHGRFLTVNSRYRAAFDYTDDPKRFIAEVHKAGYATDPTYTEMVVRLMDQYNLYRFDTLPAASASPTTSPTASASPTPSPTPSATASASPTPSATPSSPTATPTPSATASASPTPSATASASPTPSATASASPTPSVTETVSATAAKNVTATQGSTPTSSVSVTPSRSATTPSVTASGSPTASATPRVTGAQGVARTQGLTVTPGAVASPISTELAPDVATPTSEATLSTSLGTEAELRVGDGVVPEASIEPESEGESEPIELSSTLRSTSPSPSPTTSPSRGLAVTTESTARAGEDALDIDPAEVRASRAQDPAKAGALHLDGTRVKVGGLRPQYERYGGLAQTGW